MRGGEIMRTLLLERKNNNEIIDLKNNIERLRKIRKLNIDNINDKDFLKFKISSVSGKIFLLDRHC